jgi:L-ascorbate metabolism protein UlaG (beta-lactamase superfamily)
MGDCGHGLNARETAACGQVDVLLALAGGPPTLSLPDLVAFIHALKPKVVVPMHFGNDKINLNLRPLFEFLALLPQEMPVRSFDSSTVSLSPDDLPTATEVWVLPPAR